MAGVSEARRQCHEMVINREIDLSQSGASSVARPPVLLFVVNVGWFFLSHRLPLALRAASVGFEVHVATITESESEEHDIRGAGLWFHRLRGKRGAASLLDDIRQFADVLRLTRRLRPSLIHAVTAKPIVFAGLASRLLGGIPLVGALTGLGYLYIDEVRRQRDRRLLEQLMRWALGGSHTRLILQNEEDTDLLVSRKVVCPRIVRIVPGSGVDTNRFVALNVPTEPPVVLLPARMLEDKGVREFCEAARLIHQDGLDARFVLAGGLDLKNPAAIGEAELLGLAQRCGVEWWGHQSDMRSVYEVSTIVCLPSYREGLPKCLIEAASVGRAIVATDVPGCRAIVRHELEGLLVPAKDAVALARAIETLLRDKALRDRLATAARQRACAEFDIRLVLDATLAVYDELVSLRLSGPKLV